MFWNGLNKTENSENTQMAKFLSKPFVFFSKPMDFWMGTENFENENFEEKMKIPANFYKNSFCFSQNQWSFEWGLKILKMKILKKK